MRQTFTWNQLNIRTTQRTLWSIIYLLLEKINSSPPKITCISVLSEVSEALVLVMNNTWSSADMPGLSFEEEGWQGKEAGGAGLSSRQDRGGQGCCSQVNKALLPHMKKINAGGGAGRGWTCWVWFNASYSYRDLNKALHLPRPCLSACQPLKAVRAALAAEQQQPLYLGYI